MWIIRSKYWDLTFLNLRIYFAVDHSQKWSGGGGGGGGWLWHFDLTKQMKTKEWQCGLQTQIKMWKYVR